MVKTQEKLVLIDSHALIHRAYHALPSTFANKKGEPTNAVYGFTSVLLRVLRELKPDYIAAAFDTNEPTFRDEMFAEYKAQRAEKGDDLNSQIPKVKEILRAFGIKIFEKSGFEADDIIGTLSNFFSSQCQIIIVTGDLDSLQLVDKNVEVYTLKKGVTETAVYDESKVKERFGLQPKQMIDFKGLKGDPSDNIPGVYGIGEKTAIELLQQFETLENLYQQLEKGNVAGVKPLVVKKLLENKDMAFFSKKLATIRLDVPLERSLEDLRLKIKTNQPELEKVFHEMGFFSLLERFKTGIDSEPKQKEKPAVLQETLIVAFNNDLIEHLNAAKKLVIVPKIEQGNLVGIFVSNKPSNIFFVLKKDLKLVAPALADEKIKKTGYNLKLLWRHLHQLGFALNGLEFDVLLAAYVLSPGRREYPLERIIFQTLGKMISDVSDQEIVAYLWQLETALKQRLADSDLEKVFFGIELPLAPVLAEMELNGIKVNSKILEQLAKEISKKISVLEKKIHNLAGVEFNINSPSQLKNILFEKLGLGAKGLRKTAGGVISTKASELEKLKGKHEIIDLVLQYRELAKLKTTYIDPLPELIDKKTGRLHTTFNQAGTATGRLSSSDPNLQNIPIGSDLADEIRSAFVAEQDWQLVSLDYSQIELRLAAAIAQDEKMLQAFKDGKDIHALTASEIFNAPIEKIDANMRRMAKTLNFGVLYGMGARSFSESAEVSKEKAQQFIKEYFHDFAGLAKYIEEIKDEARRNGFVRTLTGRRRYLPEIHASNNMLVAQAERMAVNMPIQGTAADIMKLALISVYDFIHKENLTDYVQMLLTVHDELLLEVKKEKISEAAPKIKQIMENVLKLPVPIVVDVKVGENWGQMEKI